VEDDDDEAPRQDNTTRRDPSHWEQGRRQKRPRAVTNTITAPTQQRPRRAGKSITRDELQDAVQAGVQAVLASQAPSQPSQQPPRVITMPPPPPPPALPALQPGISLQVPYFSSQEAFPELPPPSGQVQGVSQGWVQPPRASYIPSYDGLGIASYSQPGATQMGHAQWQVGTGFHRHVTMNFAGAVQPSQQPPILPSQGTQQSGMEAQGHMQQQSRYRGYDTNS
jgi:hypothetical protein